jgi:WD40 repeat protein
MVGLRIGAILVAGLTILVDAAWAESPNEKPGGRTDRYGDPLPDTAIARLGTVRYRHAGGTVFIAFPPDAKKVISVGTDGTLRQWDLTTGKELRRFSIGGSNDVVDDLRRVINRGRCHELYSESKLALSPDASTLAVDCQDHVRLYELRTGKETQTVGLQETSSEAMALSSKGKTLAILDDRGSIQLYDLVTGHKRGQFANSAKGDYGIRGRLQFSPDGQTLVSVEESPGKTTMTIWDMIARKQLASIASQTKLQAFSKLTFSPDCRHLAWIDRKGMIILADAVSGKELRRFGKSCIFEDFAFAPDNRTLVARVCFGDDIVVLDIATGNNIRQFRVTRPFLPRSSSAMAFSADGHFLAMGSKDALISIIDFFKGKEINPADEHRNSVVHVNYGRDGRWIFSWDRDRQARVWDIETGKELRRFLLPDGALNAVYSNDCRLLAFTCIDHFGICVQDVDSKKKHRQLSRNFGLFTSLKFSPDNKRLVVVGPQQSVPTTRSEKWEIGLYDVTTGTKVRDFVVSASARN